MILHQPNQSRGARLGSPELVYIAPKGGITGNGRRAPVGDDSPLERPGVTRCAWCKRFKHVGSLEEGRQKLAEHRAQKHPDKQPRKRRHRRTTRWNTLNGRALDDNIAGVRAQGGAAWADEDAA